VPVYNEQEVLGEFWPRLRSAADALGEPYEVVFVEDGSSDNSPEILGRLAAEDPRVRVVQLSRNHGHQLAITAGYDHAAGRAVISLDGDCQHPPELIADLVARWREGFEVVYTIREDTEGISPLRRAVGRLTYRFIRFAAGADLDGQADFRLLDRKALDALRRHREHHRFLRGLVRQIGFRQAAVRYTAEKRAAGASGYTLKQLAAMSTAGVFNFSVLPLRVAPVLGGVFLAGTLAFFLLSLVLWPFGLAASGWVHAVMIVLGLFGVQFILLGLLGEYVGRVFEEAKGRPLYLVRERVGFPEPAEELPAEPEPEEPEQEPRDQDRYVLYT